MRSGRSAVPARRFLRGRGGKDGLPRDSQNLQLSCREGAPRGLAAAVMSGPGRGDIWKCICGRNVLSSEGASFHQPTVIFRGMSWEESLAAPTDQAGHSDPPRQPRAGLSSRTTCQGGSLGRYVLLSSSALAPAGFKGEARRVQDGSSVRAHGTAGKAGVSSNVAGGSSCCWWP